MQVPHILSYIIDQKFVAKKAEEKIIEIVFKTVFQMEKLNR